MSIPNWSSVAEMTWRRYCMIDDRPCPRANYCDHCNREYQQLRKEQKFCNTKCASAAQKLPAEELRERQRKRFAAWYSANKARHIANVTARKKDVTTSRATLLNSTSTGATEESDSIVPCVSSLPCRPDPTSSNDSTPAQTTGEGLHRCA